MIPVILSGGSGKRLWPVSRTLYPKQFCQIFEKPLHQQTIERLEKLGEPLVVASALHQDLIKKFSGENAHYIFEPQGRNTAPAIAVACQFLKLQDKADQVAGVFPSDHLISDDWEFNEAVATAVKEAQNGKVVVFGIHADRPATGYGYIETKKSEDKVRQVKSFKEKPSEETAQEYLAKGNYLWNSGIFVFQVNKMIEHFQNHQPKLWKQISELKEDLSNLNEIYDAIESDSIDYAIIEKLSGAELSCVFGDFGWSDVGSWDAVNKEIDPSAKNFVHSLSGRPIVLSDVKDLIVVDTPDAVLITKKGKSENIKRQVDMLENKNPQVVKEHVFTYRPWGKYEILRDEEHFKSKLITVNPGQRLSYQSHQNREEHWVVVAGEGTVVLNDQNIFVEPGSYIKIPAKAKHRIANNGGKALQFIEVQLGTYFGEDDIKRYEDDYSRS